MHSAVLFCLEAQYRLLEAAWPKEVLKLPNCREVFAADGSLLFRGPRVRMGIHWAAEGTIAHRWPSASVCLLRLGYARVNSAPCLCCYLESTHVS